MTGMRKVLTLLAASLFVAIVVQAQSKRSDGSIISHAKRIDVSRLDSGLSRQRFDDWFRNVVGPSAKIRWEANDCGEQAGSPADRRRDLPFCAQAEAALLDGRKVVVIIGVGTMQKGFTTAPAGIYYAAIEDGSRVYTVKRLGELAGMLAGKSNL